MAADWLLAMKTGSIRMLLNAVWLADNAKVALFLVSDDSAYISGATIGSCDGGTLSRVGMWFEEDLNSEPAL